MTPSLSTKELSRALRADMPVLDDDAMVSRLAQVSRTAPVALRRPQVLPNLKAAIAAASVAVAVLGGAFVSSLASSPSEPAITPPSDNGVIDRVDSPPATENGIPLRKPKHPADQDPNDSRPHRSHQKSTPPATDSAAEPNDGPTEPVVPSQPTPPTTSNDPDPGDDELENDPEVDYDVGTSNDGAGENDSDDGTGSDDSESGTDGASGTKSGSGTRGDELDELAGDNRTDDDAESAESEEEG